MNRRIFSLILITLLVLLLSAGVTIAVAQGPTPQSPGNIQDALDTGFTYQGQLQKDGAPVNGPCDLAFRLYDHASAGDAQAGLHVLRNMTDNASETELFFNGSSGRLVLNSDRTLTFDILVVARSSDDASAGYQIQGIIENDDGVTQLVGSPSVTTLGEQRAAWDVAVEADTINDALVIKVTGEAGYTIRWVATVRTAEVMY